MMLQRARAIVPLEYGSRTKLRSSTTTPLMKTVECLTKIFHATLVHSAENVLTAVMKLNSALSVFFDTYVRRVPFS